MAREEKGRRGELGDKLARLKEVQTEQKQEEEKVKQTTDSVCVCVLVRTFNDHRAGGVSETQRKQLTDGVVVVGVCMV